MNSSSSITAVATIGLFASAIAGADSARLDNGAQRDSAAVVAVVDGYHRALLNGDTATALSLLATDALILESAGRRPDGCNARARGWKIRGPLVVSHRAAVTVKNPQKCWQAF